jgi:hypothetical protein
MGLELLQYSISLTINIFRWELHTTEYHVLMLWTCYATLTHVFNLVPLTSCMSLLVYSVTLYSIYGFWMSALVS